MADTYTETAQALSARLDQLRTDALAGGGEERIARHKARGKYTARERLEMFLDRASFRETGRFVMDDAPPKGQTDTRIPGDGVVTGYGTVDGRLVYVYAQDFTVMGGTVSHRHAAKICRILDQAMENGAPVVGFVESGGARIQEGVKSLAGYSEIFRRNTLASGVVPQLSIIMGPCAGGAVYSPALTDFIFMVEQSSQMFVTGPDVLRAVTQEEVTLEELGGANVHTGRSGVAHFSASSEEDALFLARQLLGYLPDNNLGDPVILPSKDDPLRQDTALDSLVPDNPNRGYDMLEVIERIVDGGQFMQVHENWAGNILTGFARLHGRAVGIVAQQPQVLAGVLDVNSSQKGARFVRFCDAFNIPLVVFEDVPGFLPGVDQEHDGVIRHGAKLLYAFCEATVPKVTVIVRKAYGGAYCVMNPRQTGADLVLAWPTAEIAVMGADGAVNVIYRREIQAAEDPIQRKAELVEEYRDRFTNPFIAAESGYLDDIIEPHETRPRLINALEMLQNKQAQLPPKKHGNIPL